MVKIRHILLSFVAFILWATLWEYLGARYQTLHIFISQPTLVFSYCVENYQRLALDLLHTTGISIVGLIIALIIGIILAFLGSIIGGARKPLLLISSVSQTIPLIVFVPFFLLLFGPGFASKALLASFMGLFVIVVSILISLNQAANEYKDFLSLYEVNSKDKFWRVLVPVSLSSIVSSIRIAAGLSVLGAIVAEFTGSTYGLGKDIFLASVRLEPELMVISVLLCCLLGLIVHYSFLALERKLFWWNN